MKATTQEEEEERRRGGRGEGKRAKNEVHTCRSGWLRGGSSSSRLGGGVRLHHRSRGTHRLRYCQGVRCYKGEGEKEEEEEESEEISLPGSRMEKRKSNVKEEGEHDKDEEEDE